MCVAAPLMTGESTATTSDSSGVVGHAHPLDKGVVRSAVAQRIGVRLLCGEALVQRPDRRLRAVAHVDLPEQALDVHLDRRLGDVQPPCDQLVGVTLDETLQDLRLPLRTGRARGWFSGARVRAGRPRRRIRTRWAALLLRRAEARPGRHPSPARPSVACSASLAGSRPCRWSTSAKAGRKSLNTCNAMPIGSTCWPWMMRSSTAFSFSPEISFSTTPSTPHIRAASRSSAVQLGISSTVLMRASRARMARIAASCGSMPRCGS